MNDPYVYVANPDNPQAFVLGRMVEFDRDVGDALVRIPGRVGGVDVAYGIDSVYLSLSSMDAELQAIMNTLRDPAENLSNDMTPEQYRRWTSEMRRLSMPYDWQFEGDF